VLRTLTAYSQLMDKVMTDFFTADHHFLHKSVILPHHCNRPFATIDEHDESLIAAWNAKVPVNKSTVYHLGDMFWGGNYRKALGILNRLHGRICLIKGNHDRLNKNNLVRGKFEWIKDLHFYKNRGIEIVLGHYAMRVWHKKHWGAMHLYGHSHGKLPPWGKSFDVGVDCWNWTPLSLDEVIAHFDTL